MPYIITRDPINVSPLPLISLDTPTLRDEQSSARSLAALAPGIETMTTPPRDRNLGGLLSLGINEECDHSQNNQTHP